MATTIDEDGTAVDLRPRLPKKLSPSRAKDFMQCPKLFYYKTILKLPDPATIHTAVGVLAHHGMEKIFDHPREERTADNAVPYVREHWLELSEKEDYKVLADELGEDGVEEMLVGAERHVRSWFDIERPWNFDPEERELYLQATVAGVIVHGFIDRLDLVGVDETRRYIISDYKTGKVPKDRYLDETFFAMKVYALLLHKTRGEAPSDLRLVYTVNGERDDIRRIKVTQAMLRSTEQKISGVWKAIEAAARKGEFIPSESVLCGWCRFETMCPAKNPELASTPVLDRDGNEMPR